MGQLVARVTTDLQFAQRLIGIPGKTGRKLPAGTLPNLAWFKSPTGFAFWCSQESPAPFCRLTRKLKDAHTFLYVVERLAKLLSCNNKAIICRHLETSKKSDDLTALLVCTV